jgi:hypothetical protein
VCVDDDSRGDSEWSILERFRNGEDACVSDSSSGVPTGVTLIG